MNHFTINGKALSIVLVQAEDWEALYIDGEVIDQNHGLSASQVVYAIGGRVVKWDEDNYELTDYMPDKLSECKL
jgi:hypothetical protein